MTDTDYSGIASESELLPVEGGAVAFHPRDGWILVLNVPAAFIWLCFTQKLDPRDIVSELMASFDLDRPTAESWLAAALDAFATQRFQPRPQAESVPAEPVSTEADDLVARSVRVLGRTVAIHAPADVWPVLNGLVFGLPLEDATTPPSASIVISRDGEALRLVAPGRDVSASARTVAVELEQALMAVAFPLSDHRMAFHAATLCRDEAILLVAPSGSGKTTLSVALAGRGWSFGGDELSFFNENGLWSGVPLSPCIKAENYSTIARWHPELEGFPEQDRFGRRVKFLPLRGDDAPLAARFVIFPRYGSDGTRAALTPVPKLGALTQMLSQCVQLPPGFGAQDLATFLSWHQGTRYMELAFSDAGAACAIIEDEYRQNLVGGVT